MNTELPRRVYFNESPIGHCLASVEKGAPNHDVVMVGRTDTGSSAGRTWGCACARVCACVPTSVHVCARDLFAIYDDDILPRLIMIIIKIIILYFYKSDKLMISPQRVYRLVSIKVRCINISLMWWFLHFSFRIRTFAR